MRRIIQLIAILIISLAVQPGWTADHSRGKGGERRLKGPAGGMTAAQAAKAAKRQTDGRVLSVEETGGGYRVKVLTPSGEVRSINISGRR